MTRASIGAILVSMKVLTPSSLKQLTEQDGIAPDRVGDYLIEQKTIEPATLSRALATQRGLPFVEQITEQMADTNLLSKVPLKFLRKHNVIPLLYEGVQYVVTADPRDLQPLDDLALLLPGMANQAVASPEMVTEAINRYYPLETSQEMMDELKEEDDSEINLGEIEEKDIMEMANDAPIVKLVNHILYQAAKEDASDVHIEAFEKELRIRYRIDGAMQIKLTPPKRYLSAIVSRIKIMSNLNIAEKRIPQDGRIQIKVANTAYDIRVNVLPCNFGERVSMRLLDKTKGALPIDRLNFSNTNFKTVSKVIQRPNGIILVSGPTGSGKTSTLYSMLSHLNKEDVNIITVENPVEYTITGINQVQVNEKVGLTFASALRAILRQDPDIVLIGEIRDAETARIATEAALTGHLVLSTIHTNSAPATVTRLIEMGVEPFLVSASLACVISQRLVRRLDEKTKKEVRPGADIISRLGLTPAQGRKLKFYDPTPGKTPGETGYSGRLAIHEVMLVDDDISQLIVEGADASKIRDQAVANGMIPLTLDGVRCINMGMTSSEEVLSVSFTEEVDAEDSFNTEDEDKKAAASK